MLQQHEASTFLVSPESDLQTCQRRAFSPCRVWNTPQRWTSTKTTKLCLEIGRRLARGHWTACNCTQHSAARATARFQSQSHSFCASFFHGRRLSIFSPFSLVSCPCALLPQLSLSSLTHFIFRLLVLLSSKTSQPGAKQPSTAKEERSLHELTVAK